MISTQVTVWKQTQELDRRLNMLMIARAQRLAARAAKRVREIDLSGVPKFCRTLPRRFALKRFEDERLQILQRSTQLSLSLNTKLRKYFVKFLQIMKEDFL